MILKSPDILSVTFRGVGICRRCRKYHKEERHTPELLGRAAFDWEYRHRACELAHPGSVEFVFSNTRIPRGFDDRVYEQAGKGPPWLDWSPNANVTMVYLADAPITMDLSALATSSNFTAGREATAVSNSSNYMDCKISGRFWSGTSPTAPGDTRLYVIEPYEDTPLWPDVFDGTDSAETVSNTNILDTLPLLWSGTVSTATNILYPVVGALTLAQCFGVMPKHFTLFFTHHHTASLKTDAVNTNSLNYQFLQAAVA